MQRNSPSKLSPCVVLVLVVFGMTLFLPASFSQTVASDSALKICTELEKLPEGAPGKKEGLERCNKDEANKTCEDKSKGLESWSQKFTTQCSDAGLNGGSEDLPLQCRKEAAECLSAISDMNTFIDAEESEACETLRGKMKHCFTGGAGKSKALTASERAADKQEVKDARQRVADLQKEARADKKDAQTASTNAEKGGTDAQNSFTDAQTKIRDEERKALKDASASLREAYVKARAEYDAIDKEYIQMRDNIRKWEDGVSDAQSARFIQCTNYAQERWMLEERKREELDARVRGAMAQRAFNVGSLSQLSGYAKTLARSKVNRRNKNWYIFMNECLNGNVGIAKTEKDRVRKAEAGLARERAGSVDKEAYLEKRRSNAMDDVRNAGVENEQAKKDALQKTAEDTAAAQKKLATGLEAAQKQKNEQLIKQIQDAMAGVQGKGSGPEAELKAAKEELKDAEKKSREKNSAGQNCVAQVRANLGGDGDNDKAARMRQVSTSWGALVRICKGAKEPVKSTYTCPGLAENCNLILSTNVATPPINGGNTTPSGTNTKPRTGPGSGNSNGSR
jgi:hypothetical protein